ncbi:MAG TPA: HAD family hydrolase [Burkholderiales bacterium]|nr:HAD family hydrolase [Burkholderiales bacterium]
MPLQALLFDVDGTLADTERDGHRIAFNAAFRDYGLDWEWDVALYGKLLAVTGGKERIKHYLSEFRPDYTPPRHFDELVVQLHEAKTRHYIRQLEHGEIPLRPGVKRLLAEARDAGLRLAIATTTTPANVSALLKYSLADEAADWFEVIAAGDIVPAKKPASDIYLWAMQQMQVSAADCFAFEDSANGIRSSAGAGIKTLVTVNDYTFDHDFSGAVAVVSDLGEPGAPPQVLQGSLHGQSYVNLAAIYDWYENA